MIVGVDGSDGSWTAIRWAARFAAARGRELEIQRAVLAERVAGQQEKFPDLRMRDT
ncbi:hypothetical protein IU428_25690 [Nocardia abscessus]|nr:hypothetical protein [Nocardia abscessus]